MKEKQILKKAIKKAVKNGFKGVFPDMPEVGFYCEASSDESAEICVYTNIFSHNFAKAFWGEKDWQYHLQQMVLEEEPLNYLKKFL